MIYIIVRAYNYIFCCCLDIPVENTRWSLRDIILKVILKPLYVPFLGMKCLLNPEDKGQRDKHWDHKVIFISNRCK